MKRTTTNRKVSASLTSLSLMSLLGVSCCNSPIPNNAGSRASASIVQSSEVVDRNQIQEYEANTSKTILELQQFRQTTSIQIVSSGGKTGKATLVNFNPNVNAWY